LRHNLSGSELSVTAESDRVSLYTKYFLDGLQLGLNLPSTELQYADDLALLAGNALVNLWKLTSDESYLLNTAALLEFALTKSKQSFQARLILIRVYRLLGERLIKPFQPR
jgi:N-terminal acetyltransferase B complex non-catalytic subunit